MFPPVPSMFDLLCSVPITQKVRIHSAILREMLQAVARLLHRVPISEIVLGDIAIYTARVLHVWSILVSFE